MGGHRTEPSDATVRGMSMLALIRTAEITDELRDRLREAGVDVELLEPEYPVGAFVHAVHTLRRSLFPGLPPEEGEFRLGCRFTPQFFATEVGLVVASIFPTLGISRVIDRLPTYVHLGRSDLNARVHHHGERRRRITLTGKDPLIHFFAGCVHALFEHLGERPRITARELDAVTGELDTEW